MKLVIAAIVALLLYLWKTGQSVTQILGNNAPGVTFGQGAALGAMPTTVSGNSTYATIGNVATPQGVSQAIAVPAAPRVITTFQPAPVYKSAIGVNQLTAPTTPTPVVVDATAPYGRTATGVPYTQKQNFGPPSIAGRAGIGYARL